MASCKRRSNGSASFMWRCLVPSILGCAALLSSASTLAQDHEKFELALGGYSVFTFESGMSLTETNIGAGVSFSPGDTLGLDSEQTVFRLDGLYRFNSRHAFTFSWYKISSDSNRTLLEDIEWVDKDGNTVVLPTGTSVDASLGYDIFKLGYLWSFYNSDKVELAAGAGLHLAKVDVGLEIDSGLFDAELRTAKSDLPMPVVSFMLDYKVTPKFDWFLRAQLFALDLGEWSGAYSDLELGMRYRLFEHFGVGAALGSNGLDVARQYDGVRFNFDNRVSGLHIFITANF